MPASSVLERLVAAQNAHDIDAMLACFEPDYASEQPRHAERAFRGVAQVRANWTALFDTHPDLTVEVLRTSEDAASETVWVEWRWHGTGDGGDLDLIDVTILGIRDQRIAWGRLYMEPVEPTEESTDGAVASATTPD